MTKEFLGQGWKFPVGVDSSGKIEMSQYETDIKEAIWIILSTSKGERIMRPDFGCGIYDFVFAPINTATIAMIESSIREALTAWEPRVELTGLDVSTDEADEGKLLISIDYRVRSTNNEFNLVYPFYLMEGK
jgi:hypothetical protein